LVFVEDDWGEWSWRKSRKDIHLGLQLFAGERGTVWALVWALVRTLPRHVLLLTLLEHTVKEQINQ
jgi:hypothetical protein